MFCLDLWCGCVVSFLSRKRLINRGRWLLYFGCAIAVVNLFVCVLAGVNESTEPRSLANPFLSHDVP